jgi:hypothetical protein
VIDTESSHSDPLGAIFGTLRPPESSTPFPLPFPLPPHPYRSLTRPSPRSFVPHPPVAPQLRAPAAYRGGVARAAQLARGVRAWPGARARLLAEVVHADPRPRAAGACPRVRAHAVSYAVSYFREPARSAPRLWTAALKQLSSTLLRPPSPLSFLLPPPHPRPPRGPPPPPLVREGFSCCQQRGCTVGTWVGATVGRGGGSAASSRSRFASKVDFAGNLPAKLTLLE